MEEGASPPRWALDKKLGDDASMEEKKERRGEHEIEGIKEGRNRTKVCVVGVLICNVWIGNKWSNVGVLTCCEEVMFYIVKECKNSWMTKKILENNHISYKFSCS